MIVSCNTCGEPIDTRDGDIDPTCPNCSDPQEQTMSDLGQPSTQPERPDSVELSVTGIHGSVSAPSPPSAKSNWQGKEFGDYEIVGTLGKGGMGMVFLAIQKSTDRKVALKVIRDDRLNDFDSTMAQEWVARFKSEAQAAARLEHENIVTVYEVGQLDGNHFFSMQYVPGKSLSRISKERVLSGKQVAKFMIPICRALHHAHSRGILHRDIKPGNIMIDEQGRPFLTDFGLAKWFEDDDHSMTRSGQVVGTATYMSPQQATDASHATISCDVYSLGATIYRLVAGRPPFDQGSLVEVLRQVVHDEPTAPSSLNRAIDSDIETIALKCLEKNPESRYPTADELADDLQRYLNGEPISARPVSKRERFWRWCKRNPVMAGLAASAILLLLTTVVVSTVGYFMATEKNKEISAANTEISAKNAEILKANQLIKEKEEATRNSLRQSLLDQAIGMQSSTKAGRRGRALTALSDAAEIRPGLDLRNEYARYLDQPDIEKRFEIPIENWNQNSNPYAEAIPGTNRIIAVPDHGRPVELDSVAGRITKTYPKLGPFRRNSGNLSNFLAQVSNKGRFLAGNSEESKSIEIWDLVNSKLAGVLKDNSGSPIKLNCLIFDKDDTSIFCAGLPDKSTASVQFYRYSLPDLKLLSTWESTGSYVFNLSFVGEDNLLAGLDDNGTVLAIWKQPQPSDSPKQVARRKVNEALPSPMLTRSLVYDPNSQRIFVGQKDGYFSAFEFPKLAPVSQALLGRHGGSVTAVDVSINHRWLATCGEDRRLKIWDKLTGYAVTQIEIDTERAPNVQWLPDGKSLLADSINGLTIWNFLPPVSRQFLIRDASGIPQFGFPDAIDFSPNEKILFGSVKGCVGLLDLTNPKSEFEFVTKISSVDKFFASTDGTRFGPISKFDPSPLNLFSGMPPTFVRNIKENNKSQILDLTELDDGALVLTEFVEQKSVRVTEVNSQREFLNLDFRETGIGHAYPIVFVANQSRRIAIQYKDAQRLNRLMVMNLESGEKIFQTTTPNYDFAMDSGGCRVVFQKGKQLIVTDLNSKKELSAIDIEQEERFAISGDGNTIVSMDKNIGEIRIFDQSGALQFVISYEDVMPRSFAISQTGKWLALCDLHGSFRLWDLDQLRNELQAGNVMPR